jgi:K+-sensing histidine kinase KdpD
MIAVILVGAVLLAAAWAAVRELKAHRRARAELLASQAELRSEAERLAAVITTQQVRDTGIGIAADRHEAVFQAFQQADNTTERRYGGTGLGLAISRSLLQAMGRELTLESEVGLGSTFTIQLDAADSGSARPPDTPRLRAV